LGTIIFGNMQSDSKIKGDALEHKPFLVRFGLETV
jgi:hypothetical protein